MQTIKPNKTFIFAKQVKAENKTKSGIILSDSAIVDIMQANVINVGDDVKEYGSGDTILFKEYATSETKLDDVEYLLVEECDVLGKIITVEEGK